jgi:uncharacterized protein (TIGR02118 family)
MHRVLFTVSRKEGLSPEDFLAHYQDVHFAIARRFPRLQRYDVFPVTAAADGAGPDAFAMMTFASQEDFDAAVASPEFAEAVADNEQFVGRFESYVVDHIPVVE